MLLGVYSYDFFLQAFCIIILFFMEITTLVVGAIIGVFIGGILVWFVLKKNKKNMLQDSERIAQEESQNILKQAKVEA